MLGSEASQRKKKETLRVSSQRIFYVESGDLLDEFPLVGLGDSVGSAINAEHIVNVA